MPTETIQSKTSEDAVKCPACGHTDTVYTWDLLEASVNPETAQRLASGELFVHTCSECGAKIPLDYPLFYVDRDRHVSAYYSAGTGDLEALKTAFTQATIKFRGMDLGQLRRADYEMRVVPERFMLVEKVAIWHAGLDDRIVEVLKASLLDELNSREGSPHFEDAQFMGLVDGGQKLEFMLFEKSGVPASDAADATPAPDVRGIAIPELAYKRLFNTLDIRVNIDMKRSPVIDTAWARSVLEAARADAQARES